MAMPSAMPIPIPIAIWSIITPMAVPIATPMAIPNPSFEFIGQKERCPGRRATEVACFSTITQGRSESGEDDALQEFGVVPPFVKPVFVLTLHAEPMSHPIHPKACIGHVHLKVSDLERSLAFYRDVLGFEITQRYGDRAVFLSAGGYHHHIGLNTWESAGGQPPPRGATGLYHLAILYPTRGDLADALRRLIVAGIPLEGASDHGVSEALYLRDPDANGVELYWDRPREQWPRDSAGAVAMFTRALDLESLLADAPKGNDAPPAGGG